MIAGLVSTLGGIFQGFFSRSFWFAAFMPVALALALHLTVAGLAFPEQIPLRAWIHAGVTTPLAVFPIVSAGVIVLAYAMGPLAPVAQGLLDGSRLPLWVQKRLRADRVRQAYRARLAVQTAASELGQYRSLLKTEVPRMIAARQAGMGAGRIVDPVGVRALVATARALEAKMSRGSLPTPADLGAATARMVGALAANAASLPPGDPDGALAKALSRAQGQMVITLQRAAFDAEARVTLQESRYGAQAGLAPVMPTRIAEARQAAQSYSLDVYGVDFDFIWPRLWLVMKDKDNGGDIISDAQAQVDFSVMSVCLVATVPILWTAPLVATQISPWLFLAVAAGGPMVCAFFYELAVASQQRLAQVVKAAIDRYRLDLLDALHQPRPATRAAERRLWKALQFDEDSRGKTDVVYRFAAS